MKNLIRLMLVLGFVFCSGLNVSAADAVLSSAGINAGVLTVSGSLDRITDDQYLTVTVCPITDNECDLNDIVYIDQQRITDKNFALSFPLSLGNGVYAARIGGNGIKTPQYIIITKESGSTELKLGDVDENGRVEAADATVVLQYVLNKAVVRLSPLQLKAAKVTAGSGLTADDAAWILQKALNGTVIFPIEQQKG